MPNKKLFDEESSDEDCSGNLSVNKTYAENYKTWRKKEYYQRLKDKYGVNDFDSESDSEESNDEEYVEPDNPEFDMDFFRVLSAVRMKHPILDTEKKFFKDSYQSQVKEKITEEKPLTVTEYEKKLLLERGGKCDDEDEEKPGCSYYIDKEDEFTNKKEKFKFDDNLSENEDEDLFTKKEQPMKEVDNDKIEAENEAIEFLKGKKKDLKNKMDEELLGGLKQDWETQNMSKKDRFLLDYFVNKRYLEDEDDEKERAPNHRVLDLESLEDDEETYNKMEEYESKYRFRYEEPDEEFIRQYPRVIEDSVRLKDNKRKDEREKRKERQKEEEERKKQEILRLKAFKKQEILERIDMLKEAAGMKEDSAFKNFNLDEDFDPDKHDTLMSSMFNNDYYEEDDGAVKPTFEDEELQREIEEEYEKLKELDTMAEGAFKYRNVCENSYGLTTKEILYAKDTELNRWYSINGVMKYREGDQEELRLQKNYAHRAKLDHVKQKIFPSLYLDNIEEQWKLEEEKKRRKNLKKKERKMKKKLLLENGEAKEEEKKTENELENGDERLKDSNLEEKEGEETMEKKNKKQNETENISIETKGINVSSEKKGKKKRKKKKNENVAETNETEHKSKKRKRNKSVNEEHNEESSNNKEEVENTNESLNKNKTKKRKKDNEEKTTTTTENENENSTKSKKEKIKPKREGKTKMKKPQVSKEKMEKRKQLLEISDARLAAYGQNPKKLKKLLKYSEKYN